MINIESSSVKEPIDNLALSNAVRPGVVGWAKSLAREVGPTEDHRQHDRAGPDRDRAPGRGLQGQAARRGLRGDPAPALRAAAGGGRRRLLPRLGRRLVRDRRRDSGRRRTDAQPALRRISSGRCGGSHRRGSPRAASSSSALRRSCSGCCRPTAPTSGSSTRRIRSTRSSACRTMRRRRARPDLLRRRPRARGAPARAARAVPAAERLVARRPPRRSARRSSSRSACRT